MTAKDPNWEPYRFVYLLMTDSSFANKDFGWASGVGAWLHARHFQCYNDARDGRADPRWHNDQDGIRRAKIVRLAVSVEVKIFD